MRLLISGLLQSRNNWKVRPGQGFPHSRWTQSKHPDGLFPGMRKYQQCPSELEPSNTSCWAPHPSSPEPISSSFQLLRCFDDAQKCTRCSQCATSVPAAGEETSILRTSPASPTCNPSLLPSVPCRGCQALTYQPPKAWPRSPRGCRQRRGQDWRKIDWAMMAQSGLPKG